MCNLNRTFTHFENKKRLFNLVSTIAIMFAVFLQEEGAEVFAASDRPDWPDWPGWPDQPDWPDWPDRPDRPDRPDWPDWPACGLAARDVDCREECEAHTEQQDETGKATG